MITLRKLASLKEGTRLRKAVRLLQQFERGETRPESAYLKGLYRMMQESPDLGEETQARFRAEETRLAGNPALPRDAEYRRTWNSLRHLLLAALGQEPADWDFPPPQGEGALPLQEESPLRKRRLYLDDIRSPFNLGAIFRTAAFFGISEIWLSRDTVDPDHPRARRSAMGCIERVPWKRIDEGELAETAGLFALESGGAPLPRFAFPEEGIAVLGSEELGVSPALLAAADASGGRVTIPGSGGKGSLNVGVACGIMLSRWCQPPLYRPGSGRS